jgi:hypothetical protein
MPSILKKLEEGWIEFVKIKGEMIGGIALQKYVLSKKIEGESETQDAGRETQDGSNAQTFKADKYTFCQN